MANVAGVGRTDSHQVRDDAAAVLGGGHGLQHGSLFDNAVLHQALRQTAERRAGRGS